MTRKILYLLTMHKVSPMSSLEPLSTKMLSSKLSLRDDTQLKDSQKFLDLLTYHDFESAWVALGKEQQETLYLKAFQRDAENNPLTGALTLPGKVDAPELCRDTLNKDKGRGFIELMNLFVLPDNDKAPAQPFVLENKRFDKIIGFDKEEKFQPKLVQLSFLRLLRSHFIQTFVLNVVALYHGKEIKYKTLVTEHSKTKIL
ncbi:hypothetical protein L218DRAFT_304670 [Marasmius fiardii PR-910]|nr:hypothetical protein L218DRAFT_304670 [Marasmius fiardii PR-910]